MARGSLHFLRIQLQQSTWFTWGLVFSWVCTIRGRSHIAPKNAWKTLGALLSPFFQCARAVALRRRLSLLSNHQLRSPLHLRHSEKLRCFYLDAARTRLEKTSASLPLWARIPRVYIWNNELKRAKDAICERPLKTPVLSVCIFLVILAPVSSSTHYLLQLFPRSDFFLLSNECVLKCSEVQYFPQNILK